VASCANGNTLEIFNLGEGAEFQGCSASGPTADEQCAGGASVTICPADQGATDFPSGCATHGVDYCRWSCEQSRNCPKCLHGVDNFVCAGFTYNPTTKKCDLHTACATGTTATGSSRYTLSCAKSSAPALVSWDSATWAGVGMAGGLSAGDYGVCLCEPPVAAQEERHTGFRPGTCAWRAIPSTTSSLLAVTTSAAALTPAILSLQRFTVKAGEATKLQVKGVRLTQLTNSEVGAKTAACNAAGTLTRFALGSEMEESAEFEVTLATAREYFLCACEAHPPATCNNADFTKEIGKLVVTSRVTVGRTYVLPPNEDTSIEIGGTGLLTTERIMVVDCGGQCGVAGPTKSEAAPADRATPPVVAGVFDDTGAYVSFLGRYCIQHHLGLGETLAAHACASKCMDGCVGDHCHCEGYKAGIDTMDSTALCVTQAKCQDLCDATEGCYGIDMHKDLPRCFLNSDGCASDVPGLLGIACDYNFLLRGAVTTANAALEAAPGISTSTTLRFSPMRFSAGGTFKVCFCDRAGGGTCDNIADYKIEVGTVYVSGISCLLDQQKFRRLQCTSQYWGGLSCAP